MLYSIENLNKFIKVPKKKFKTRSFSTSHRTFFRNHDSELIIALYMFYVKIMTVEETMKCSLRVKNC